MISVNRPKMESRPYEFLLHSKKEKYSQQNIEFQENRLETLNTVFSAYENNNRRTRPPPDRGTLKIISRLLIT